MLKSRNITIKGRIFIVFIIFAIVLLSVLWFFQIIYLKDSYKIIKRKETETVMNHVESILLGKKDIAESIDALAAGNNSAIYITDSYGDALYNAEYIANSRMSSMPNYMFKLFYSEAVANGGEVMIEFRGSQRVERKTPFYTEYTDVYEFAKELPDEPSVGLNGNGQFKQNIGNDMAESVIYIRVVNVDDVEYVIMVNSVLTPVDATVTTLKSQLFLISIVMIILAFGMAGTFSRSMSKSIVSLSEGAKELAAGNYDVTFDSRKYKEISDLSDMLNFAAKELGKTDALQKELIANVSHDLRTPLTMIKGYSEVMRDIPGENTPENVQVIIEETERLTWLVNDLLDISKLKAGTMTLNCQEYNITASIRHVFGRYNKLREVEGFTIDFNYDRDVEIYADEQKIFQVLYNLINNAMTYSGEDKKVTVTQKVVDNNTLRIEISDTGPGVPKEEIPYVWERYYKGSAMHRRAVQGTGLGLSIVKNILELHEAKYGIESEEGHGATVWFELPINEPECEE